MSDNLTNNSPLNKVEQIANDTCQRLQIPAGIIALHNDLRKAKLQDGNTLQGYRQHQLRWGAFLLTYACIEGFFNRVVESPSSRTIPLNPDKISSLARTTHAVELFTNNWWVRTLVQPDSKNKDQFGVWRFYNGTEEIRNYLSDMKSLRDILSHGGNPDNSTNKSGCLWTTSRRSSLRMLGVEGFMQSCFDLIEHTLISYGAVEDNFPAWPEMPHIEFQNYKPRVQRK